MTRTDIVPLDKARTALSRAIRDLLSASVWTYRAGEQSTAEQIETALECARTVRTLLESL